MADSTKEYGAKGACMVEELILGLMGNYIKDNIKWIRRMDLVVIDGKMVEDTSVIGLIK